MKTAYLRQRVEVGIGLVGFEIGTIKCYDGVIMFAAGPKDLRNTSLSKGRYMEEKSAG